MDSTTRRVTGLTLGEAFALREVAGAQQRRGGDVHDDTSTTATPGPAGYYRTRLWVAELAVRAGGVALGAAELVLALAVWVIATVAPRARRLAEWLCAAVASTDAVLDDDQLAPAPSNRDPAPDVPYTTRKPSAPRLRVVDGEVLNVTTINQKGAK